VATALCREIISWSTEGVLGFMHADTAVCAGARIVLGAVGSKLRAARHRALERLAREQQEALVAVLVCLSGLVMRYRKGSAKSARANAGQQGRPKRVGADERFIPQSAARPGAR